MKKIALLMAAVLLTLSFASCGNANKNNAEDTNDTTEATTTETVVTEEETTEAVAENADAPEAGTFGAELLENFRNHYAANNAATAEELAGLMIANENIPYMMGTMPVEVGGFMMGFDGEEGDFITGYKDATMFAPMIGVIPFIGYVFTMDEGADIDAFVATLKDRANPRWNICTEADQVVVDVQGDKVFFVMCPFSTEVEE